MSPIEFVHAQHICQIPDNWWHISSCIGSEEARCCNCVFAFHGFPSFTMFCHFFPDIVVRFSFLWLEEVLYFVFPSLFRSSHSTVCLVLGPGFHFAAFFVHRSSGNDAILITKRHVVLLCVSIHHEIFAAFILSTAIAVLFSCI